MSSPTPIIGKRSASSATLTFACPKKRSVAPKGEPVQRSEEFYSAVSYIRNGDFMPFIAMLRHQPSILLMKTTGHTQRRLLDYILSDFFTFSNKNLTAKTVLDIIMRAPVECFYPHNGVSPIILASTAHIDTEQEYQAAMRVRKLIISRTFVGSHSESQWTTLALYARIENEYLSEINIQPNTDSLWFTLLSEYQAPYVVDSPYYTETMRIYKQCQREQAAMKQRHDPVPAVGLEVIDLENSHCESDWSDVIDVDAIQDDTRFGSIFDADGIIDVDALPTFTMPAAVNVY